MLESLRRDTPPWQWGLFAAIIGLATFLRIVAIEARGLWTDEALTIVLANWPFADMLLKPTDESPFLYYFLHKLFLSSHSSIAAIRSISVVAGVSSVVLMYALGRLSFGSRGGLLAAALLAVWTAHVDYSQEARAYSALFLFTLTTSVGLLHYAQLLSLPPNSRSGGRRAVALVLFGAGNVLSFYTHVIAIVWIAMTSLTLLFVAVRKRRIFSPEVLAVFGLMAVCALPGIYRLILQMMAGDNFHWLRQPGFFKAVGTTADVFLPIGLWDNPITNAHDVRLIGKALVMGLAVVGAAAGLWFGGRRLLGTLQASPILLSLVVGYLIVPAVLWLFGFLVRPVVMDRTILFSVPGAVLGMTGVCIGIGGVAGARTGVALVLVYGVSTLLFGFMREKEDWRGAYAFLAASASQGDVIAVCSRNRYPALRYHASAPVASAVIVLARTGRAVQVENALGSNPNWDTTFLWYVYAPNTAHGGAVAQTAAQRGRLQLTPGQSVWRVDGHCMPKPSADMDALLRAVKPDEAPAWTEEREHPSADAVTIRRYRVVAPVTLEIERTPL